MSVVVISRGGLTGTLSIMNISSGKIELTHVHAIIWFKLRAIPTYFESEGFIPVTFI